jgi:signal transduction histidine kinase/DNA-binding NarL/FixJ family response regulator
MATPRRLPSPEPGGGARPAWRGGTLGLVGLVLGAVLVLVVLAQARQFALLDEQVRPAVDRVATLAFQAEADQLRLVAAWPREDEAPLSAGRLEALRRLNERWGERLLALLAQPWPAAAGRPVTAAPAATRGEGDPIGRAMAFTDATAGVLARAEPDDADTTAALLALRSRLLALEAPMQALSAAAAGEVAEGAQAHLRADTRHGLVSIGLTVFLSALTVAFALIALRQLRQLDERRRTLEDLAEDLRVARREAEAASDAKSAFLANMSHEIRTPFQGLLGMLSLLRETGLSARQTDFLRTATESADHLLQLLNDILDLSQLESGRMTLAPGATDLRGLLREVEALMRPQAMGKALALHLDAEPDVPERVLADAKRVKQVLFNLLSNAIKFSDRGAVVLDVRRHAEHGGDESLEFVVTDTGIGMDEASLGRLFRRFEQGDPSISRRHGGTGLGLEISRNLARLMGGDITVKSRLGEGSSFTFRMPLRPVAPTPLPDPAAEPVGVRAGLEVLVAEDHPVNRQYMAALLENLGHVAHFTTDGEEALAAARRGGWDLVLMDLHMPRMDGIEATRAIRALPDRTAAAVPIVALTADAFPETRERCLVAGMNDFLTKPVSPGKLASTLRRFFGGAAVGASASALAGAEAPPAPVPHPASRAGSVAAEGVPLVDAATLSMTLAAMPPARFERMAADFLDQGPATLQRLHAAVRDAQPLELRVHAHAARGAALNLGFSAIAATAEALHEGASHLPAHEIARLVRRFEDLLPATRAAVAAALAEAAQRRLPAGAAPDGRAAHAAPPSPPATR